MTVMTRKMTERSRNLLKNSKYFSSEIIQPFWMEKTKLLVQLICLQTNNWDPNVPGKNVHIHQEMEGTEDLKH